ncbi:MAG: LPS assembly protein LptD [Deltaproteobacteria bacterium]
MAGKGQFIHRRDRITHERLLSLFSYCVIVCLTLTPPLSAAQRPTDGSNAASPLKQSTILPTDVPIELSAERLSFNYDTNTYTARGNVTLRQGNTRMRADSIQYEGSTGELTARGRVIVRMGSDVVEADKIALKLANATGVLFNGKLLLTKHNVYLEGKKLERTGTSTYRVEEGSFTTCDGARPDWRITGQDLDVTLEGYGTLKNGIFYIKDIPVFYLPWLVYPVKQKRQTGFLMPSLSNSTLRGFDVRFPFFLAISRSVDATITPRICTKRAIQASLECRYVPYEDLSGRFYGEYTYDWKFGPETDPRSHRFYVTWRHDQDLAGLVKLKANVAWVSDREYFEIWGGRFDRRKRVRYLESNAVVYRQSNNLLFQAEARHFDNLDIPDNAVTVQNLPIVTGTAFNQQVPYTPLYLSSNIVYNHFYAPIMHKQWLGSRLQFDTRVSLPIVLGRYLKIEPSITYFGKAYSARYYEHDKSLRSVSALRTDLFQLNGDLFTDLDSVYNAAFLGFQRIKHNVRPRFTWTYRPRTDSQIYPQFDESDRLDEISLVTAELRQALTGRLGPHQYLDFMTLRISQGYDFSNLRATGHSEEHRYPLGSGWTSCQAELTFKPHSLVDLVAQADYDPLQNRARQYSLSLGVMDHRGDLLRVLHQFVEDETRKDLNRQTNVNVQVKLGSTLDCFFENQYTHQFHFSYYTSVGLIYHPQCWNVELRYSEARARDPVTREIEEPDQTIFMTISLYGLGQVYRTTRDWGELLGEPTGSAETTFR